MSDSFAYIDIIFFAMVAAFIAIRLRSVLGRKTGHERRRQQGQYETATKTGQKGQQSSDNVVKLPDRTSQTPEEDPAIANLQDNDVKQGLTRIRLNDHRFDLESFLQGARAAFGMIIEAFANGEREVLRPLLSDDVYGSFETAIREREEREEKLSTELVSVKSAEVAAAEMQGSRARVTVKFVSEQINVVRNVRDEVVDGDSSRIDEIVDLWTFERDTRSADPNWILVETRAPS